jgi:uncharacterized protein YbjT (DUF2867 family)
MIAVLGVTGQVGSVVARTLLDSGGKVRVVVRDEAKGNSWKAQGADVSVGDVFNASSLVEAWKGCEGVFIVVPPSFAPAEGFPEIRALAKSLKEALYEAKPVKVVVLSTVGAHRTEGIGILTQLRLLEEELTGTGLPMTFVRAGWFIENAKWDLEDARKEGEIASFLQPLDRPISMVSTVDVGRVCARCLLDKPRGLRIVELEGPRRYSPNDLAEAFSQALNRSVRAVEVPKSDWKNRFESQGMPADRTWGRIEMLDGFNSGWIDFESESEKGTVTLQEAIARLAQ